MDWDKWCWMKINRRWIEINDVEWRLIEDEWRWIEINRRWMILNKD